MKPKILVLYKPKHDQSNNFLKMAEGLKCQFLKDINLVRNIESAMRKDELQLESDFHSFTRIRERHLDRVFNSTMKIVYAGHAWATKAISRTSCVTFKPAMRKNEAFQRLPETRKEEIYEEQKHIRSIVRHWDKIVYNCNLPEMIHFDIKGLPLWKIARCSKLSFVQDENSAMGGNTVPRRPVKRTYEIEMVDDMINNVPGSTQRLLDQVNNDKKQIKLIGKDVTDLLLRRAEGHL